ncbi:hypothetical protein [Amycolatopsis sp. ATCC 39116]|uniref:hypothetical protein n=1 Tax=Amycolatopsis sp. (strain ATCC 39116 / 75iv2) TaxID=385957 RepID=UPI0002625CE7|nr:hypothetical protein [Amycolatopsis sp. ATCC 39116]
MAKQEPDDIASDAWDWYKRADNAYRRTKNGSSEEMQAIQAMALSAMAALYAEEVEHQRRNR